MYGVQTKEGSKLNNIWNKIRSMPGKDLILPAVGATAILCLLSRDGLIPKKIAMPLVGLNLTSLLFAARSINNFNVIKSNTNDWLSYSCQGSMIALSLLEKITNNEKTAVAAKAEALTFATAAATFSLAANIDHAIDSQPPQLPKIEGISFQRD